MSGLTEREQEALAETLGASLYESLMESSADQWRRWRFLTDFAKESYRTEAARIIAEALTPAVERIVAERERAAQVRALRDAATALERRAGDFKHLPGDKHVRRTHNDIARWLRARADQPAAEVIEVWHI
jgi:hypothetical protein